MNYPQKPIARKDGLVIQKTPDEILIYDLQTSKGFSLNRMAAFIWKNCDGENSVGDIVRQFENETGVTVQKDSVKLAIDQLGELNLLETNPSAKFAGESRRSALKKIGLASMVAVPVMASLASEAKSFGELPTNEIESTNIVQDNTESQATAVFAPPNLIVPCSDRLTPLRAGANVMSFIVPAIAEPQFYAYLTTAAKTGTFTVDLKRDGVSILSTKISIDAGNKTSVLAATPAVVSIDSLALGDEIVVDITDAADGDATGLMILLTSRGATDKTPPTVPGGLVLTVNSATQMTAEWAPSATN